MPGTQPALGGFTLPWPNLNGGYVERVTYRGGSRRMADGSTVHDLVQASEKREWDISWTALSASEKSTVESAFAAVKDGTASFTAVSGSTYTVTRREGGAIEFVPYVSAGALLYRSSVLALIED